MNYAFANGLVAATIRGLIAIPLAWWGIARLVRPLFHIIPGLHPRGPGTSHLIPPAAAVVSDFRMILDALLAVSLLLLTERGGWSLRRLIERTNLPMTAMGFRQGVWGAAAGLAAALIVMVILVVTGCAHISQDMASGGFILRSMILWAGIFLMVGFAEELAIRGYALRSLAEGAGFWVAALLTSAWFASMHLWEGDPWWGALNTGVFGFFMACTWRATGSLGFAIGYHAAWDYTQSMIFGVPDSSFTMAGSLLSTRIAGPVWLAGGPVGPEGSILTYIELAILITLAIRVGNRRGVPPAAGESSMASVECSGWPTR